ncbi:NUDIX hydrolase [Streptomyces sp. NPDC002513]
MNRTDTTSPGTADLASPTATHSFHQPTPLRGDDVPLTRSHIRATTEAYLVRHPHERKALAGLPAVLDRPDEPTSRATLPGHITCSATVIDRERRVLHIGHKASGKFLTPGGHDDRTLLAAALREAREETGILPQDLCLTPQFLGAPIDVHDIDANPAKNEPAHQYFDFRFVFYLMPDRPPSLTLRDEEVCGARWLAFADVRSPTLRAKPLDAKAEGLDGRPEPVNASALIHDGHGRYLLHLGDQRESICDSVGVLRTAILDRRHPRSSKGSCRHGSDCTTCGASGWAVSRS